MTRLLLAGASALALMLLPTTSTYAQTQTPAAQQTPAAGDQPATDQGSSSTTDAAPADDDKQAPIPFEGGQLTITSRNRTAKRCWPMTARSWRATTSSTSTRVVKVGDVNVALVDVGDGGNQCGPAKVIVWKPEGGDHRDHNGRAGRMRLAAGRRVTDNAIYFVPYLLPGESKPALQWSPTDGLTTSGNLSLHAAARHRTGRISIRPKLDNIIDAFDNEAVYKAAEALLGETMPDMATGLLVGGGTEKTASGAFYASGCVPHDCGGADAFMAVDPAKHTLYFARRGDKPEPDAWPAVKTWPADVKEALDKAMGSGN